MTCCQRWREEIDAIAKLAGFDFVFFLNFMYETQSYCISIIKQDSDGLIIHGETWITISLRIWIIYPVMPSSIRSGTLLFKANIIAGYVGILTGMKPNAFAITANQRNLNDSIWNNVWYFLHYGALPMTYLARKTLEEELDYQSACNRLSETAIIAPVYYIFVHRRGRCDSEK